MRCVREKSTHVLFYKPGRISPLKRVAAVHVVLRLKSYFGIFVLGYDMTHGSFLAADHFCPRQAFEGLDREGKGFLTAEGIKQVVGLDFDTEEVGRKNDP